ncbi:MAG: hypothetical protein Q4B54_08715 [Coriobacteriales bacterium]|nr:hypothetical protein [Coriobacteriales bacterium]
MANAQAPKRHQYKKSYLDHRLQQDVMVDGVAHIPCKVDGTEDIISRFSIPGCESCDQEFLDYVVSFIDFIPTGHPISLDIYGPRFTPQEQAVISKTIESDLAYIHGKAEDVSRHRTKMFIAMIIGALISGVLLRLVLEINTIISIEWTYVIFWLFADAVVRYLFIEKVDYREEKQRAARLEEVRVEFKVA